ncbi:hypothetical protein D3C80_1575260 [compost metagenome]
MDAAGHAHGAVNQPQACHGKQQRHITGTVAQLSGYHITFAQACSMQPGAQLVDVLQQFAVAAGFAMAVDDRRVVAMARNHAEELLLEHAGGLLVGQPKYSFRCFPVPSMCIVVLPAGAGWCHASK